MSKLWVWREKKKKLIEELPFYDGDTFCVIKDDYDVIVYSPLIDYSIGFYHSKNGDKVVYGNCDFPDLEGQAYLTSEERAVFRNTYDFDGAISESHLMELLKKFKSHLSPSTMLVVLTGSEVNINHPEEPNRYLVHKRLNKVVERFCSENENVIMLDVRKYLVGQECHTDNIRHYTRNIYFKIAEEIIEVINTQFSIDNTIDVSKELKTSLRVRFKEILRHLGLLDIAYKMKRRLKR